MPLSGAQVTRLWPYGGPGHEYSSFDKGGKPYVKTFTRQTPYGTPGIPYGSFAGKAGGTPFDLETTGIAVSGVVGVSGDLEIEYSWEVEAPINVSVAGAVSVSGDLEITASEPFDLAQTANVAASGVVSVSGDLEITPGVPFDLAQTANIAATGVVGVSGDLEIITTHDLAQTSAVAVSGAVAVFGDLEYSTTPRIRTFAGGGGRRNYIIKGRRYYNLTNEELAYLIAREFVAVDRTDIKVTYKNKKPHAVSKTSFETLQAALKTLEFRADQIRLEDDEDELLMVLM